MANIRGRGDGGGRDDRLPWLQEADADEIDARFGFGRIVAVLAGLFAAAVLVTFVVWWIAFRDGSPFGSGQLIRAPEGPYRTKPAEAGGMKVEGAGDIAYGQSEGQDIDSAIDLNAVPEAPITGAGAEKPAAAVPAPAAQQPVVMPQPAQVPQQTAPGVLPPPAVPVVGGTIQLGAFTSAASAQKAWKSLSGRFAFLGPLQSSVAAVQSGERTLYRLRADAGPEAANVCQRLKVAGETCSVVG